MLRTRTAKHLQRESFHWGSIEDFLSKIEIDEPDKMKKSDQASLETPLNKAPLRRGVLLVDADALYAFKSRGFGGEIGTVEIAGERCQFTQ